MTILFMHISGRLDAILEHWYLDTRFLSLSYFLFVLTSVEYWYHTLSCHFLLHNIFKLFILFPICSHKKQKSFEQALELRKWIWQKLFPKSTLLIRFYDWARDNLCRSVMFASSCTCLVSLNSFALQEHNFVIFALLHYIRMHDISSWVDTGPILHMSLDRR